MKLAIAILTVALLLVPSVASAHTGSITDTQKCGTGTTVTAHLDDNVADTSTWTVTIDGSVRDQGSGPGPADLGPYSAGHKAGSATLDIDFGDEHHEYTTEWPAVAPCPARYAPRASISPACGDPMIRMTLDNRHSDSPVTFRMRYHLFSGGWVVRLRSVPGGILVRTPYRHLTGSTKVTIRALGHVLASRVIEPPGSYGDCPQ